MSLFVGVTGFALVVYGAVRGGALEVSNSETQQKSKKKSRANAVSAAVKMESAKWKFFGQRAVLIWMVLAMLLLALGSRTPLFRVLYELVPGFNKFRGISKFIFQASLFIALLAATGFDRLLKTRRIERAAIFSAFGAGVAIIIAGLILHAWDWPSLLRSMQQSGESYLSPQAFSNAAFIENAKDASSRSLFIAAATFLALGGLLAWMRTEARAVYAIGALAVLEVFVFARGSRDTFDSASVVMPQIKNFLNQHPGDYRIVNLLNANSAVAMGAQDMWGNDPSLVRRYAEFMAFTQGLDPDKATQYVSFARLDPLYAMLRLQYAFVPQNGQLGIAESPNPMPHVALISRYRVLEKRDAIFSSMRDASFDPRREVILEREPEPKPAGDAAGGARVLEQTTDSLTIEADAPQPAILLVTDVYTPAWRAVPLAGSVQTHYDLMPANYTLRAVPLAAGHHKLRVEYHPRAFVIGAWISIFALVGYVAAIVWWLRAKN
jgi:hypothetical protein